MSKSVFYTRIVIVVTAICLFSWLGYHYYQRYQAYQNAIEFWPAAAERMNELAKSNSRIKPINVQEKIAEEQQDFLNYRNLCAKNGFIILAAGGILFFSARWIPALENRIRRRIEAAKKERENKSRVK